GDPDAILDVVWNTGRQAAGARAWAAAVRATRLPYRFIALRDELARTVEQPLRELAAFGPGALASIDQELRAQHDGPPRVVNLTLTFALENQQGFEQALEAALRESAMSNERAAILAILRARVSLLEREHSRRPSNLNNFTYGGTEIDEKPSANGLTAPDIGEFFSIVARLIEALFK